jgi:hypothetical protein
LLQLLLPSSKLDFGTFGFFVDLVGGGVFKGIGIFC